MSSITSPSRISKEVDTSSMKERVPRQIDPKLETRLNTKDLEALQDAFMAEGDGYDNRLNLNRDQFVEALSLILSKGAKEEYGELFDKIDVTKDGVVDWDKFASHMLLEFYERDDRVKSTQVPQWKDLKTLASPHKEVIQKILHMKSGNKYLAISKEGCVSFWGSNLKLQRSLKTGTDSCRTRDLWVTNFVCLWNINKMALSFTSKEIAIYDLGSKVDFNCQYKLQGLEYTPLCLDYWPNPQNVNEAILAWGDTGGCVNALEFNSANIALFERPPAPAGEKQEPCLNVQLKDILKKRYKNALYSKHKGHTDWVRQVHYSAHLECFISCATTWTNSVVIGWMEKHNQSNKNMKTTTFQISQGVNALDYHEPLNLIATAGVNHHVCLWNPYVVSKPNGVLRGHMASVVQVQFNKLRHQLISFSKDKVLRIWDVQLQVCIQRLAGMFPKGPEVSSILFFDERTNRLFITFNYQLTVLEMKPEIKNRIMTHDKPVIGAIFNPTYNQVVSVGQGGSVSMWMLETGQKVKSFNKAHGDAEISTLAQDHSETRIYTGSTDGTVKIWDFNGHCYHTLHCTYDDQPADIGRILSLKRSIITVGWAKYVTVFRSQSLREFHVEPSDWKGGQEHLDDVLAVAFSGPNILVTGSYDGQIVIWNNNTEQASKRLNQRARKPALKSKFFLTSTRENTKISDGGFDSHSFKQERPRTRPKSRESSRISMGSTDDSNEYGFAITRLIFLEARKGIASPGGANLMSCGGNGWVRFWNTANTKLLGEFCAHLQVGSIIMAVDPVENRWLCTGDVDGLIKVWDISDYCLDDFDYVASDPPPMLSSFQAHLDMINSLEMCERNERMLILSASSDCSVQLWDIYGHQIGIFGQEAHWKIEPYSPEQDLENELEDETNEVHGDEYAEEESVWEPDDEAVDNPAKYRINVWESSNLGKDYQEIRVKKRERKQPETISDLPYLHWERTGAAPAGPFAALDTSELRDVDSLSKPDFMANPHKYFSERATSADMNRRKPGLAESLNAAYDEKTLFPKYILDFEAKMKQFHQKSLVDTQKKAGHGLLKMIGGAGSGSVVTITVPGAPPSSMGSQSNANGPSPVRRGGPIKPQKLKPLGSTISSRAGSVKDMPT